MISCAGLKKKAFRAGLFHVLCGQEANHVGQVKKESSLKEPVRSKLHLSQGGKVMDFSPIVNGTSEPLHIQASNKIETTEAFTSYVGHGYGGSKGRKPRIDLLSNDIRIMGSLGLKAAVVGPKIDRRGDTGNTTFVNLTFHKLAMRLRNRSKRKQW